MIIHGWVGFWPKSIYFVKSVTEYDNFASGYNSAIGGYRNCQKISFVTGSGKCRIKNGGGIVIHNRGTSTRMVKGDLVIDFE